MDYFENTTRITEDGYAAILQMQKKQHCIICRAIGILLAIPFLERLIYRGILLEIGDTADFHLGFLIFTVAGSRLLDVASTEKTDTRPHSPHKEKTGSAGSQSVHFFTGMYPHDEYFLLGKIPAGI